MSVIYVKNSKNTKISSSDNVDATYVAIKKTCPDTCSLKQSACYASLGYTGFVVSRLEKQTTKMSAFEIAKQEAKLIDESYQEVPKGQMLRLHVSGDTQQIAGAKLINAAVKRWKQKGGFRVWSYTHSWKTVPRKVWSNVSMLASVDNIEEVKAAQQAGYVPAIIVDEFSSDKAFYLKGSTVKWIPCPAQTRHTTCDICKLCMNDTKLKQINAGIAFAAHGVRKEQLKKKLKVVKG